MHCITTYRQAVACGSCSSNRLIETVHGRVVFTKYNTRIKQMISVILKQTDTQQQ